MKYEYRSHKEPKLTRRASLAGSIPRMEHETIIAELQLRITDLEARLCESKSETKAMKDKVAQLESGSDQLKSKLTS